jgi:hypothetical protein
MGLINEKGWLDFLYYGELAPNHTVWGRVEPLIGRGQTPARTRKILPKAGNPTIKNEGGDNLIIDSKIFYFDKFQL